ncbi:hypothetical protein AYO20_07476 [Fonsecaea nubica]|uniref:Uncharacterized protein n=1 Tax=Fonsecaea nubica TaxID=856822 RepID=A0A178CVM0_9EURO|nr:hypothetical protein AYO20_07476 [Fonsecaea nubica]OAL33314.1 hypothetical protein AYO20_07476 [Fonsecaea nubica]
MDAYYVAQTRPGDTGPDDSRASSVSDENRPSPCYTTFSGVTLDQTGRGQLSEFHGLENDGTVEEWNEEWKAVANEVGGSEKLESRVKIGLAAVRIRVGNDHLQGFEGQTAELSGFRLSQDLVITCAHFTDWSLPGNKVEFYLNGQNGICEAIQARKSRAIGHKGRLTLHLWAIHEAWDIAVFRVTGWPENNSKLSVLTKQDIYSVAPEEWGQLKAGSTGRFWSIGYNLAVNMEELRERFAEFLSRRQQDEKAEISQRYEFNDANPPGIEFLQANRRTISFGMKMGIPSQTKEHQACAELSAWYGRSGSMVCAEKDGRSVVIGIVQGGEQTSDGNLIMLFNTNMQEWWTAATELGNSAGAQDISKRVVMR